MRLEDNAGARRAFPWRAIRSVNDTGRVVVPQYVFWRSANIPRRAYADEGAALWRLLGQQLIAVAVAPPRAGACIIVDTAAR